MSFQEWIKPNDTASDESIPSDAGIEIDHIYGGGGASTSTSDSDSSEDKVGKKRRICLIAGIVAIIVLGIAIAVAVLLATGVFSKSSASSNFITNAPTITAFPSDAPSMMPVEAESLEPTVTPFPTSPQPSQSPTNVPTKTMAPSSTPTDAPTGVPSTSPTYTPTTAFAPVPRPPTVPLNETSDTLMTFCVIADVPYDEQEAKELPNQIATQMDGCEFMIHLGDLFIGDTFCEEEDYHIIRDIMLESKVATFVVPGDNEWNDCQKSVIQVGWDRWIANFLHFENYWAHNFTVARQPGYEENFYFIHKRTLVMGLNIVGGRVHNTTEWSTRLTSQMEWVRSVVNAHLPTGNADGVILMSHAKPSADHLEFTMPLRNYIRDELQNQYPILYLHGDGHDFMYTPHFLRQPNLLRMQHEGGVNEPILKILADPAKHKNSVYNAFQYDRQLELMS